MLSIEKMNLINQILEISEFIHFITNIINKDCLYKMYHASEIERGIGSTYINISIIMGTYTCRTISHMGPRCFTLYVQS